MLKVSRQTGTGSQLTIIVENGAPFRAVNVRFAQEGNIAQLEYERQYLEALNDLARGEANHLQVGLGLGELLRLVHHALDQIVLGPLPLDQLIIVNVSFELEEFCTKVSWSIRGL